LTRTGEDRRPWSPWTRRAQGTRPDGTSRVDTGRVLWPRTRKGHGPSGLTQTSRDTPARDVPALDVTVCLGQGHGQCFDWTCASPRDASLVPSASRDCALSGRVLRHGTCSPRDVFATGRVRHGTCSPRDVFASGRVRLGTCSPRDVFATGRVRLGTCPSPRDVFATGRVRHGTCPCALSGRVQCEPIRLQPLGDGPSCRAGHRF
jgi:hypothetical protein